MSNQRRLIILACTGMGKILASVGRAAEFLSYEKYPKSVILGNFPGIAAGLEKDLAMLNGHDIITLTGCTENCPEKILHRINKPALYDIKIWEVFREYKEFKPETRNDIGTPGLKLAEKIVEKIKELTENIK